MILEKGSIGQEASWAAAGMLAPQAETDKADTFFQFCHQSNKLYPDFCYRTFLRKPELISNSIKAETLYLAFDENDAKEIRHRYEWQTPSRIGS